MKVYQGIEEFEKVSFPVVTSGTFDGVHIGHQVIINRLKEVARKNNGESVLLTFYPHPRMVLQPEGDLKLINTIEEKTALLKDAGLDHLIIHPFTKNFSRLTSLEFVRDYLVNKIGTQKLVIGYDHHFGRNREGSFEHLMEFGPLYGFDVEEIPAKDIDQVNVSSTKIRQAILEGDMETAHAYLGHPFQLSGEVVHGKKLGRELGYPTANLDLKSPYKIIPAYGIYAVYINYAGQRYRGMLNIGVRPTVDGSNAPLSIEVNIFDFDEDIYGQTISIDLIARIRDEVKFDSLDALVEEMQKDKQKSLLLLE